MGGAIFHSQLKSLLLIRARCELNFAQPWRSGNSSKTPQYTKPRLEGKKWWLSYHVGSYERWTKCLLKFYGDERSLYVCMLSSLWTFLFILERDSKRWKHLTVTSWLEAINYMQGKTVYLEAGSEKVCTRVSFVLVLFEKLSNYRRKLPCILFYSNGCTSDPKSVNLAGIFVRKGSVIFFKDTSFFFRSSDIPLFASS